jgi:hypothetical protein
MRKLLIMLLLTCGVAVGQIAYHREVTLGTNGVGSVTFNSVRGELQHVYVYAASTGTVTLAYAPALSGVAAQTMVSGAVSTQKVFRVVAQSTDAAGTAITDYNKYVLAGEDVTFSVADGGSNAVWKAVIVVK